VLFSNRIGVATALVRCGCNNHVRVEGTGFAVVAAAACIAAMAALLGQHVE
jgi:hypothetical protein